MFAHYAFVNNFFKIIHCVASFVNISKASPSIPIPHHTGILHYVQFRVQLSQDFACPCTNSYPWCIFFARALVRPLLWCRDLFYLATLNFYAPLATFTRQCMYDLVISGGEEEIEKPDFTVVFYTDIAASRVPVLANQT